MKWWTDNDEDYKAHLVLASSRTLAGCRTGSDLLGMLGVARWGVRGVPGVICQTGNRQRRRGETQKQRADRLRSGGFRSFYLLVGSFSWRSGRGASFLLRARSARPRRSMSAPFQHDLLVTFQRCLVLVAVVLAAALQLLLGGNKLVLVLSVWVQVLLVLQKIPAQTDSEAQNSETFWISQLITHDVATHSQLFSDARRHQLGRLPLGAPRCGGDRQHRRAFVIHLSPVHQSHTHRGRRSVFNLNVWTDSNRQLERDKTFNWRKNSRALK